MMIPSIPVDALISAALLPNRLAGGDVGVVFVVNAFPPNKLFVELTAGGVATLAPNIDGALVGDAALLVGEANDVPPNKLLPAETKMKIIKKLKYKKDKFSAWDEYDAECLQFGLSATVGLQILYPLKIALGSVALGEDTFVVVF